MFYHEDTLRQLNLLRTYLFEREAAHKLDSVDRWIRMVAVSRLAGHSPGFFSVYTFPPNQAVTVDAQRRINERRDQSPEPRAVAKLIRRKSRALLKDVCDDTRRRLVEVADGGQFVTSDSSQTPQIRSNSVSLVVTSPPFLDVVDYATDNWLRCWFCGIDPATVALTVPKRIRDWQEVMTGVFRELARILKPGGYVAFEVGEVRNGSVKLEEYALPCGTRAGLSAELVLINDQAFTKTANIWGVENQRKGTNTNRIVLFRKRSG